MKTPVGEGNCVLGGDVEMEVHPQMDCRRRCAFLLLAFPCS